MHKEQDLYYKLLNFLLRLYKTAGVLLVGAAFAMLLFNFSPNIWYTVDGDALENNTNVLLSARSKPYKLVEITEENYKDVVVEKNNNKFNSARKLPDKDPSLPTEPTLIIKKIGVNTRINRGDNGEKELDKGVWMPPEYKDPTKFEPIMLLAHRFGYLSWSGEFRKKNSFYNLPKLEAGDEVIIVWNQRPYKYKVTSKFNAKGTANYTDDLVMYTCKFFNSQERIVVVGKRIN